MTDFADDLAVLDQEHDTSKVKFQEKAPDGAYQARLDICRVGRSKSQRLQTFMRFEIVHGEHEGRIIDKYAGMETTENLDFLTRDIWNMAGEKVQFKWKDVESVYKKILDTIVEIRAVTNEESGIQNVFIQRKITKINGKKDDRADAKKGKPPIDDDVPF